MKGPYFSILLPTKNRATILGDAIRSVLAQTFGDFELIVSDNDDSFTATRDVVAQFTDPRIVYVRTSGKLPMHENWDTAFSHATGRQVLVLEDKMRLVVNALSILHDKVESEGVPVSFPVAYTKDSTYPAAPASPKGRRWKSTEIVDGFVKFRSTSFDLIPKGLDCCVPRQLLIRIKAESPTGFLFSYICPDYAFGFMVLSRVDEVFHLEVPMNYIPNNWMWVSKFSNGLATYRKDDQLRRFMQELPVSAEQIMERVPVKVFSIWINMVLYDFFTKYSRPDHRPKVDWAAYHAFVMTLILLGKKLKADMTQERTAVLASLRGQSWLFRLQVFIKFSGQMLLNLKRVAKGRFAAYRQQRANV